MEVMNQGVASSLPEEEKGGLDLNKVPSKSDSPSAAGSDSLKALGNAGNTTSESSLLMCENNADSRDDAVASDFIEDAGGQSFDEKKRLDLVSRNSDISHEGMDKSQPSKCREDNAGLVGGDQCANRDGEINANDVPKKQKVRKPMATELNTGKANEASKGRRGRKRMVAVTTYSDKDLETMSEELIHAEARKEQRGRKRKVLKSESCNNEKDLMLESGSDEKSSCLESQLSEKNREESNESNVVETSEDDDLVEAENAGYNTKKDVQKFSSRRRGRKRKVKKQLRESHDDEIIDKKAVTSVPADTRGTVGRVLRSRTQALGDSARQVHADGNEGLDQIELEKEDQASVGEDIEMKMGVSSQFKLGMKDSKKGRGRPPKLHIEKGLEEIHLSDGENIEMKMAVSAIFEQGKEDLKKRRGRPPKLHKEKGLEKNPQPSDGEDKEMNFDVSAQFERGMKDLKKRRGRPPKLLKERGLEKEIQSSDGEDIELKMNVSAKFEQGMNDSKKRRGRSPKLHKEKGLEKENQPTDGEEIEMKMDVSANFEQGTNDSKKRRGRPPKLHKENGLEKENQPSNGEDIEMKMDISTNFEQVMKNSKKRRGRPPKLHKEKGLEKEGEDIEMKMDESENFERGMNDLKKRRGRPPKLHKEEGLKQPSNGDDIETKMGGSVQFKQGMKYSKKKPGRPPKLHKGKGNPNVSVKKKVKLATQKFTKNPTANGSNSLKMQTRNMSSGQVGIDNENFEDRKESNNRFAAESKKCAGDRCQSYLEGGSCHSESSIKSLDKSECKKKKDEALSRSEEKQLVRDHIVSILKNAGWTIQHRPRMGREYLDAVYVDREGKTYWSVTLAYKTLRASVQDGTADKMAVAAFIPIPEEKLSTLFRHSTVKRGEGKKKEKVNKARNKILKDRKKSSPKRGRPKSNRRTETKRRYALSARRSETGSGPGSDGFITHEGKLTLLSWMIDSGTLPPGGKIQLLKGTEKHMILEGKISQGGICCGCCNADVALSIFQAHAGYENDPPFDSIYMDSGLSLSQCLADAWRKHVEANRVCFNSLNVDGDDPNDDTCNLCGDGGDLICCDGCPSTFHPSCLRIQVPSGDWQCVYCSCKFCEMTDRPCLSDDVEDTNDLLACLLCEEKFHIACIQEKDDTHNATEDVMFCGRECQKIFERLHKLLGVRHELEDGFSWTILRCQDVNFKENCTLDLAKVVCNSKLVSVFSIMNECFSPIIDPRTQTNIIQRVIFNSGSNFRRLNYSGFCTIILERGDELVAAAAIRIHGHQLAEMPFIGTRSIYRRQGMCRRLFSVIETTLSSFDVEKLVIPAVPELIETWKNSFGFAPLEESERQYTNYMSLVVFPGTNLLQKPMCKREIDVACAFGTSNEVVSFKDDTSRDVGKPQSSITQQYDPITVFCDDKEASKCKLKLNPVCSSVAGTVPGPRTSENMTCG